MIYTTITSNFKKTFFLFLITFFVTSIVSSFEINKDSFDLLLIDFGNTSITDEKVEDSPIIENLQIALIKVGFYDGYDSNGNCISAPGQLVLYTFSVKNTGNVTLSNIMVTDPLITVSGGPITLVPGEEDTTTFTALYPITQNDIDTGFVVNQAEVEACYEADSEGNCDGQVNYLKLKYLGTILDANIEVVEHDGQTVFLGIVQPGEEFEFFGQDPPQITFGPKIDIFINNSLNQSIHTSCSIPIGIGSIFGDFEVIDGSSRNGGPFIPVVIDICDEVSDLSDDDSYEEDEPTVVYLCQDATIALIKTGTWFDENQNGCADVGETINYSFSVKNTGIVPLTNVIVTDPLLSVIGVPIDLAVDEENTTNFTGIYILTQDDIDVEEFENQAGATGTPPTGDDVTDLSDDDSYLEDDPTVVYFCQNARIALIKVGIYDGYDANGNCISAPEQEVLYTFSVKNTGNVTLSNIMVTDPLVTVSGGPITLAPEEEDTTTFTALYPITQNDIDTGYVENQAEVEACYEEPSDPEGNCDGQVNYLKLKYLGTILDANIEIVEHDGQTVFQGIIQPGEEFEFYGQDPPQITFGPKIRIFINNSFNQLIHTSCSIPIGIGSIFGNFEVIDGSSRNGGPFISVVGDICDEVYDLSDDDSYLEDDPTVVYICQNTTIALIKTGIWNDENQNGCADVEETIDYTFSVKNTGNVDLTNVIVTDPLLSVIGGPIDLAVDEENTTNFTGIYILTQDDIDVEEFMNQAGATGTPPTGDDVTDLSDDDSYLEDDPTVIVFPSDCITLGQNMVMYPNPTSNSLNINLMDGNENFGYSIINIQGQVVKIGTLNNGINTITLGNLNTGLYFVKVQNNTTNKTVVNKLIVK